MGTAAVEIDLLLVHNVLVIKLQLFHDRGNRSKDTKKSNTCYDLREFIFALLHK